MKIAKLALAAVALTTTAAVAPGVAVAQEATASVAAGATVYGNDGAEIGTIEAVQGDTVILESTSPVGTTEAMRDAIAAARPDLELPGLGEGQPDVSIAYCPERVLPGKILEELTHNDRSIGGITPRCARKALAFYKRFVKGECVTTDARSAEMTKLVENAFRDVNIAFANELSMIADKQGLDVWEVIRMANRHPRVNILTPGPGVGGHCIAVDPWFIVDSAPDDTDLIRAARKVNDAKPHHLAGRIVEHARDLKDPVIACLGLAYKADIDDLRESPAITVVRELAGADVGEILAVASSQFFHLLEATFELAVRCT